MADSDLELDDVDETLSKTHNKLLSNIERLDLKQRIKKPVVTEPVSEVSEFHLSKSGIADRNIVNVINLTKNLNRTAAHGEIKKEFLKSRSKAKTLPKPLEKPVADRIKRTIGFDKTKKELTKWTGIVARNRTIGHLTFPLTKACMKNDPRYEFTKRCTIKSDLQKEFEKLEPPKEEKVVNKQEEEYALTKEELLEKNKEAAKLRAQETYKAAKARRQNKIKSKKFHRIQRKQKLKAEIKEFEELQKTDPEAALEKLEMLDKVRAKERMSLRHKNTGQWAKNLQVRAKYDKESRKALAQQLAISRELTTKLKRDDDSEKDDEETESPPFSISADDKDNPWMNTVKTSQEIDNFVRSYRNFWDKKEKEAKTENLEKDKEIEKEVVTPQKNLLPAVNPVESFTVTKSNPVKGTSMNQTKTLKRNNITSKTNSNSSLVLKSKEANNLKNHSEESPADTKFEIKLKPNITDKKIKSKHKKQKVGTSQWIVEDPNESNEENNMNGFDDLFDKVDEKIQKTIDTKLKRLRQKVDSNSDSKIIKKQKTVNETSMDDYLNKLGLQPDKLRPSIDEPMNELVNNRNEYMRSLELNESFIEKHLEKSANKEISAESFIEVKPQYIKSKMPNSDVTEALDDSDVEDQNQIISEAFQDDDAITDFKKDKEEEIKSGQPKDIDLTLPGWGSWGGKDIKIPNRKRKKFLIKMPKADKRKDENKGNVIIIEEKEAKIRKHLVSEVPFPFKNVTDFEANLRAPIGRDFVPETIHRKLTQPAVKTKMGKIIEPMDEEALLKKVDKRKKLFA